MNETEQIATAEHDEEVQELARQVLSTDQHWLARHLEPFGARIDAITEDLIALALDLKFDHETRERAARAACRLTAVNEQRLSNERRFSEDVDRTDFDEE